MDPNTELILNEMNKRFTELDSKWEQHFTESESRRDARISTLEEEALAFDAWKPNIDAEHVAISNWKQQLEASVDDLKLEVTKLHKSRTASPWIALIPAQVFWSICGRRPHFPLLDSALTALMGTAFESI